MKLKISFILLILSLFSSCSKEDKSLPEPETEPKGTLEVLVHSKSNVPVEGALVATVPKTESLITESSGKVTFKDIRSGDYEVVALLPEWGLPSKITVTVVTGKTTTVEIAIGPDPLEPTAIDIDALLNECYKNLKGKNLFDATGYSHYWGDIGADVLTTYPNAFVEIGELNVYNFNPNSKLIEDVWIDHYKAIQRANLGIDAIVDGNFTSNSGTPENVVEAEFRFIRAMLYFNLVKIYGNPILVTTAKINLNQPLNIVQDPLKIYKLIEEDLVFAENNLSSSVPSNRASVASAEALLGKVYLQMAGFPLLQSGNYSKALAQFKKLEGLYSLEPHYSDIFSLDNESSRTEVIFRIDFDANSSNGGNYGVYSGPLGIAYNDIFWLTPGFAESYSENPNDIVSPVAFPIDIADSRFYQNVATFTFQNGISENAVEVSNWRPYKFIKELSTRTNPGDESFDFPYLRYADVLLMLAEAENAINGPTSLAYEAVNQVSERAYGNKDNYIPSGLSQQAFLEVILEERRRELCFEGVRKDDLIRTQQLETIISAFNQNNPGNFKNYLPHKYIWPIPQSEINSIPDIIQNAGY